MDLVFLRRSLSKEVVLAIKYLHVPLVVRSIFVIVFWVHGFGLDLEKIGTRRDIVKALLLGRRIIKLSLVVQRKMLRLRGVSLRSELQVRSWLRVMMMLVSSLYFVEI